MTKIINRDNAIKLTLVILGAGVLILLYIYRQTISGLIYPFIISFFISYLLNPLITAMEAKGIKRSVGIIIIYAVFLAFLLFVCLYMVPILIRDMGKLIGALPGYNAMFRNIISYYEEKFKLIALPAGIKAAIDNNINRMENYVVSYLESATTFIILLVSKMFNIMLMPILVYYFLKDFKNVMERLSRLIPRKYRSQTVRIFSNVDSILGNYVRSQLILSAVIGIMTTVALFILRINFAIIIGIINGVTNIIPYFGPIIGAIPAVLIALLQSPVKALYTIGVLTVIQQVESDIICPKITADSVDLHPLTVIFALMAGGELFGVTGLILGVPVAAALKVIYRDVMKSLF